MSSEVSGQEKNIARLLRASYGPEAQPGSAASEQTWSLLQAQLRSEHAAAPRRRPLQLFHLAWQRLAPVSAPARPRLHPSAAALALVLVLLLLGSGLVLAAAGTLPGDTLYPVKRATEQVRLLLTVNSTAREELQANLDAERLREVRQVLASGRQAQVEFKGALEAIEANWWHVAGLQVALHPDTEIEGQPALGVLVLVEGETQAGGLLVAHHLTALETPPSQVLRPPYETLPLPPDTVPPASERPGQTAPPPPTGLPSPELPPSPLPTLPLPLTPTWTRRPTASTSTPLPPGVTLPAATVTAEPPPSIPALPTHGPTRTGLPMQTPTWTPSQLPLPTMTQPSTQLPTVRPTAVPTATPTRTSSPRPTIAPTRTNMPTPTRTAWPTRTNTPTPTRTAWPTWTNTPTPTHIIWPTWTRTPTPTWTPTYAPTGTPSRTPSPTWTATQTLPPPPPPPPSPTWHWPPPRHTPPCPPPGSTHPPLGMADTTKNTLSRLIGRANRY